MKLIFVIALLAASLVQTRAAGTYLLLTQTNALTAGITNLAKAYTDAHAAPVGTVINTQGGAAGVPLALTDSTGTNAAPFYGGEPVSSKTAAYSILYTDNDTFFIWNSATNCTVTFADGATNGFNVTFKNLGAGSLILTNAAGKTFDSQTSVTLPQNTISHWIADGTNYRGGRNGPNNLVSGNKVFASPSDGSSGLMIPRILVAADFPATGTAGTYTKTTFDAQGRETSGTAAVLASADFANQGTTTTVFHGNASGNPSFGAVSLTTDVSGTLPVGNLPGSGASTVTDGAGIGAGGTLTIGSAYTLTSASASPTFAKITASKAFQAYQGSLTHAGTITLDFDATTTVNALALTGNVTFATSNLATNRTYRVKITSTATNDTPTFPAWKFVGGVPSVITANKTSMLSLEAWGTTDASVVAAYSEE